MPYGLRGETLKSLINIFQSYPEICRVILYGSRAKGNYRKGSDIDLTMDGDDLSTDLLYEIQERIDELYLPYTVDLSIQSHIDNTDLINHIDRVGEIVYSRRP